mgnify:FL=1
MTLRSDRDAQFVVEERSEGRTLVVTGSWTAEAQTLIMQGEADGLELNYARGFSENDLQFVLQFPVRRLLVLDRSLTDLAPIARLAPTLQELRVQAAPKAKIDLRPFSQLLMLAGDWIAVRDTLSSIGGLRSLTVRRYGAPDLTPLSSNRRLASLVLKDAPGVESLRRVADFPDLTKLSVLRGLRLHDLGDVGKGRLLRELELENCPRVASLGGIESLKMLRFLGVSDCGDIDSFRPLTSLQNLEVLHAWGTTRIVDADLSPLSQLGHLREIRMRDRREYRPRLTEIQSRLHKLA